ncbi:MAG: 30S ribosomal protein S6 [Planctomycetota bacterium]|nr:30S ribosomal protein S6 [Planctomycetota bacterium]
MAKAKTKEAATHVQYEAMFLLGSGFATELENAQKMIRTMVERHGGEVLVLKKWDERKLAYEVGGQKRGLYLICYYKGPGASVMAIERDVNLSDQILRVLITKADHLNPDEMAAVEPQPIQPREERNPWDRPSYDDRPSGGRGDRGDRPSRSRDESPEAAVGKE